MTTAFTFRAFAAAMALALLTPAAGMANSPSTPAVTSSAVQHMVCEKNLFGCKTLYRGPADVAAARAYFDDANAAMTVIVENFASVQSAHYTPGRRLLVIEAVPGKRVNKLEERDIENIMLNAHLAVDDIRFMSADHRRQISARRVMRDFGGHSRYSALRHVNFEAQIDSPTASQKLMVRTHRAGAPRNDAFGNIFISMR